MGIPPRILTVNRIPYRIWFATSHQEVETKISFPLFGLFRGNGSWCRISRVQSPSHHIISELKIPLPKPSEVEYEIFFACDRQGTKYFFLHRATLWVLFRNKCIVALVAVVAVGMWATLFALSIMSTAIRLRQRVGDEI